MIRADGLIKYECGCGKNFIVGETYPAKICPYCGSKNIEQVTWLPADDYRIDELGCMGIYVREGDK